MVRPVFRSSHEVGRGGVSVETGSETGPPAEAITEALERNGLARAERMTLAELRKRYAQLTAREQEVLPLVVAGFANKQTAAELGNSGFTVAIQRGQIMRKRVRSADWPN